MRPAHTAIFTFALTIFSAQSNAAVLTATAKTLVAVFARAGAGDTIKLTGSFGRVNLSNRSFSTALTIDASKAKFTDTLLIQDVSGLVLKGGYYGSSSARTSFNKAIAVYRGNNVTVDRAYIIGAKTGTGMSFVDTTNVIVSNSTFDKLKSGVGLLSVTGATLINNRSRFSTSDGFDVANSHSIMIKGNSCMGGSPGDGAHPDCVQLWSIAGNPRQSDITITGNTASGPTQGFTSFDEAAGGGLRIVMTNNRVDTSYSQGIACYGCIDSVFTGNVVTTQLGAAHKTNINIIDGINNIVSGNSIGALPKSGSSSKITTIATSPSSSDFLTVTSKTAATDSFDHSVIEGKSPGNVTTSSSIVAGIPEPASWLLMIAGFGLVGSALRRRSITIVSA